MRNIIEYITESFQERKISKLLDELIEMNGFYKGYDNYKIKVQDLDKLKSKIQKTSYGYSDEKHVSEFVDFIKDKCKEKELSEVYVIDGHDHDNKDGYIIFYNFEPFEFSLYRSSIYSHRILTAKDENRLIKKIDKWMVDPIN